MILATALAALALSSAAQEPPVQGPPPLATPELGAPPASETACACVKKARCWALVKVAFARISNLAKTEVEGARDNRFFPRTRAWALHKADPAGHFLKVDCLGGGSCEQRRDELERRLAMSALLQSLPGRGKAQLFDSVSWQSSPQGDALAAKALKCRPSLWAELSPLLLQ